MKSDPRRLLEEGGDFERKLLAAASADEPSDEHKRRVARAIAVAAAAGALMSGSAAAATTSVAVTLKWLSLVVVAGAVTLGAGYKVRQIRAWHSSGTPAPRPTAPSAPLPPPPQIAPPPPATAPAEVEPTAPADADKHVARVKQVSSLERELAQIDQARREIDAGQYRRALDDLSRYQRQFRRPTLAPEMTMLRIEALVRMGQRGPALALARSFLRAHPESPLGARVRSLIGP